MCDHAPEDLDTWSDIAAQSLEFDHAAAPSDVARADVNASAPAAPTQACGLKCGRRGRADHLLDELVAAARQDGGAQVVGDEPFGAGTDTTDEDQDAEPVTIDALALRRLHRPPEFGERCPLDLLAYQVGFRRRGPATVADDATQRMCAAFLNSSGTMSLQSNRTLQEKLQIGRTAFSNRLLTLGATTVHVARAAWSHLEAFVSRRFPRKSLLVYMEKVRYDETPLRVVSSGESSRTACPTRLAAPMLAASRSGTDGVLALRQEIWTPVLGERVTTKASASKVVQFEVSMGMLIEDGARYYGIVAPMPCRLQLVERCTAKALSQACLRQSVVTPVASLFQHRLRDVTTDEAASNKLCEKSMPCYNKCGHWMSRHGNCEVHVAARIFGASMSLLNEDISGMLRHALSLQVGASMNLFRRALREEIRHRGVRILRGPPPLHCFQHRRIMMRLFCARGANSIDRRLLLALLPNGDWTKRQVEIFVPNPDDISHEQAVEVLCNGLTTALAGLSFHLYPRSRWTGADLSLDQCGILEAVHGLGSGTYARFMTLVGGVGQAVPDDDIAGEATGDIAIEDSGAPDFVEATTHGGEVDPDNKAGGDGAVGAESNKSAAFNDKSRRMAAAWWQSQPFPRMVLMRLIMEPVRVLLAAKLEVSGEAWEKLETSKLADRIARGCAPRRDYVVSLAASNSVENECLGKARALMQHSGLWVGLPLVAVSVKMRCLAFRMLSRVRTLIHELLVTPHGKFPIVLFRLLQQPDLFGELQGVPECMRDDISHEFLTQFAESPNSPRARAFLEFLAFSVSMDTAQIEARHASIRRWLFSRSTQTHTMEFTRLSTEWVLQQARRLDAMFRQGRPADSTPSAASRPQQSSQGGRGRKRKFSCAGGGQRAYISQQSRLRKLRLSSPGVMTMLNAEYKALRPTPKAKYKSAGKRATQRKHEGLCKPGESSFGVPKLRVARAKAEHQLRMSLVEKHMGESPEAIALALADISLASFNILDNEAYSKAFSAGRTAHREAKRQCRLQRKALDEVLSTWRSSRGVGDLKGLLGVSSSPHPFDASKVFLPVPGTNLTFFKYQVADLNFIHRCCQNLQHDKAGAVRKPMHDSWQTSHATILENDCPELNDFSSRRFAERSPCWLAGRCLCSPDGKKLRLVRNRLAIAWKKRCPAKSPDRTSAKEGFFVLRVWGGSRKPKWHASMPSASELVPSANAGCEHWWHLGSLNLSPLRFTFLDMTLVSSEGAGDDGRAMRVVLHSGKKELTEYEALEQLSLDGRDWHLDFYVLENAERQLGEFMPGEVGATLSCDSAFCVWGRPAARGRSADIDFGEEDLATEVDTDESAEDVPGEADDDDSDGDDEGDSAEDPGIAVLAAMHDLAAADAPTGDATNSRCVPHQSANSGVRRDPFVSKKKHVFVPPSPSIV